MRVLDIRLRPAERGDARDLAAVADAAWLEAYRGILPGRELEQMLSHRGPAYWDGALTGPGQMTVLEFDGRVVGYAAGGRARGVGPQFRGEVYELYVDPVFQGLGFGRLLFAEAMRRLKKRNLRPVLVWVLAENERAVGFYKHLGGKFVSRADDRPGTFGSEAMAFAWG